MLVLLLPNYGKDSGHSYFRLEALKLCAKATPYNDVKVLVLVLTFCSLGLGLVIFGLDLGLVFLVLFMVL